MKSPQFPSTPDSQRRGTKRRLDSSFTRTRFRNEASATGEVHISEIDPEGQFVRLENKSAQVCVFFSPVCSHTTKWTIFLLTKEFHIVQDVVIGGWSLQMVSNNGASNETRYKIHSNQIIKAHATTTVGFLLFFHLIYVLYARNKVNHTEIRDELGLFDPGIDWLIDWFFRVFLGLLLDWSIFRDRFFLLNWQIWFRILKLLKRYYRRASHILTVTWLDFYSGVTLLIRTVESYCGGSNCIRL